MTVLIADKFETSGVEGLKALGCRVVHEPDLKDEALAARIESSCAHVLIVRSTKVTESMLSAGKLSLVIRAGAGYNTIDVAAASKRGIYVANCPGKNAVAVAELTMGLILDLDRRIADNVSQLREGQWSKGEFSKAKGLYGRTLGLIGLGNIGQEVAQRAKSFGMNVIGWSRSLTPDKAEALGITYCKSPEEAASECDILSVHLALSPDTRGLINKEIFEVMKPGSFFINTSRAEVVDQAALIQACESKNIRAGLDVFEGEPSGSSGEFRGDIGSNPNIYCTHHIGASTEQAQEAIAAETVRIVKVFMETGEAPNVVNMCRQSPATHVLSVRHKDRVGVLAHVFDALREAQINVQETTNSVFEGAEAAIAQLRLDRSPDAKTLDHIRSNGDILSSSVVAL